MRRTLDSAPAPRTASATTWQAIVRAPFAMIGVATDGHAVTRVSYLPRDTAPMVFHSACNFLISSAV